MTTALLARRFLRDYARNPVNLVFLALVPVAFVVVAAGSLADAARLLGGAGGGVGVEVNTAGWAAGFLAAIAMYFQTSSARNVDRRLVLSGLPASRLVMARLAAGLALAALATTAALLALAARGGIGEPMRTLGGSIMFALIYLAIGAVVGALLRNPVNGTVLILFVWILDVFFGPVLGAADRPGTRLLPTHFVSLWMTDLPSGHGGRLGDLGWALAWTAGALVAAWAAVVITSRVARPRRGWTPGSAGDQLAAGIRLGVRDLRRNPVLWVLLIAVPVVFILLADAVTPDEPAGMTVVEGGREFVAVFSLARIHAGIMAPIAVASLAALTGLFIVLDARSGDRRLALAGFRPAGLLASRLAVVGLAAAFVTAVSLAVVATVFSPRQWAAYAGASLLLAGTYGLLGVLLGPLLGRVSGVFIVFLVPFLDIGIAQSPMLRAEPAAWAQFLPGYGGSRVLLDGALTGSFDQTGPLLAGLAWFAGLILLTGLTLHQSGGPRGDVRTAQAAPTGSATFR